nr:autoinducer binding domain-containing protein [Sphingobium sp. GW456-12-10-14-TSB1]
MDLTGRQREAASMASKCDKGRLADISVFEHQAKSTTTFDQLSSIVDSFVRQVGFRWFALLHNVDLVQRSKKAIMLTTYPVRWLDEIIETRLYLDDPIHAACAKTSSGLTWDRIDEFIVPSPHQVSILKKGSAHGLRTGFTMPIRMQDEPEAVFTIARSTDAVATTEDVLTARLVGTVAFDQARAILGDEGIVYQPVSLSPRQIDCIALVAQGKSDWEISQILSLGRDTVHEYVEGARRRYGVRRRTQLVLRAVRDGHLNINALL